MNYLTATIQLHPSEGLSFAPKTGNIQAVTSEILGDGKTVRLSHPCFTTSSTAQATLYELYDNEIVPVCNSSSGFIDVCCYDDSSNLKFFSLQILIIA